MAQAPAIPDTPNPMTPVSVPKTASTLEVASAAWQLSHRLAGTEFVPGALRNKPEAVLACILSGHELGIGPMQALQKIHVIDGRPAQAAELMRGIVQSHGHEVWFEDMSTTSVTIVGKRSGQTRETRVTWTLDDAKRAGLTDRQNWRKYPRAMLMARATGELCRALFADVLAGISYTMEELSDGEAVDVADLVYRTGGEPTAAAPDDGRMAIESPGKATRARKATTAAPATPKPAQHVPLPGEEDDVADGEIVDDTDTTPEADDDGVEEAEIRPLRPPDAPERPEPAQVTASPANQFPDDDEPPVDTGPRYTPAQAVVMRMEAMGFTDRDVRLAMLSSIVEREITSTNDLTYDEVKTVMTVLDEDTFSGTVPEEDGDVTPPGDGATGGAAPPAAPPPSSPPPTPSTSRRSDPEAMTGDQWRDVLKRRGVKAAELLKRARESAGSSVATLDDISGKGIGQDLLDFVEDLALSRGK